MKHLSITVSGQVQGVAFRAYTKEMADSLHLVGWVVNAPNGQVCVEAEGEESALQTLLDWCKRGPPLAVVEEVSFQFSTILQHPSYFEIRRFQ